MTAEREGLAEELHEALHSHRTLANSPGDCVCACDRTWRPTADYRAHLADALADLLAARDRRVRGEALREALAEWEGGPTGQAPIPRWWLSDRADRIEAP